MADITMCSGQGCPLKDNCYRYNATATPMWQSYFSTVPVKKDGTCEYHWSERKGGTKETTKKDEEDGN